MVVRSARLRVYGMRVTPMSVAQTVEVILDSVVARVHLRIGNLNMHGLYMLQTNPVFRDYTTGADLCLIDGWPLLALLEGKIRGRSELRVGSSDWLFALLDRGMPLNVLAIGGTPESAARARAVARSRWPHVAWTAVDGYELQASATRALVRAALPRAELVLVGLGMPLQERWILENVTRSTNAVVANVGGCIDYIAGTQRLAPRWLGSLGLEWAYRLAVDPRRLAHRYLVEPIALAVLTVQARLRGDLPLG